MRMALSLSVLLHVLLLSIPMQGDVFGLSGLRFPWEERRLAASDLQIVLAPAAPAVAPPSIPAPRPTSTPASRKPPADGPSASVPVQAPAKAAVPAAPRGDAIATVKPQAEPEPEPEPDPDRQAAEQAREVELIALARAQAEREATARVEAERASAYRRELTQKAQLEAERQEREATAQREAARQEAIKQEDARREQAEMEQVQREQARQEQARQEQAKLEEAQREQERASQAQASQSPVQQGHADRRPPAQLAPRAERLRAIAEQLARESPGRDRAGSPPGAPQPTVSGQRRGWLFGRADPNQDMVLYAQAMGRKIELNRTLDMVREAVKQPHTQPVVTVAVRADGSVEKVTFETSSGVPAIDEGIRKIIASQAPYGPFPPALARQYDVVEIRRTWLFDVAVRLQ